jgi:acyl-CoA synthetase (AMP-forming)/AMP-acid ligase II
VTARATAETTETATIWSLAESRAATAPDDLLAVDESGRTLTFGEFRARAESVAAGLAALGVGAGTRVSWQLPTWLESFLLVGALCRLGALQNPMLPIYRERELRFVLGEVQPELLVVPEEWRGFEHRRVAAAVVAELGLACRIVTCDRALPEGDPGTLPPPPGDPSAVRWVFYTSGTTADPKGALHSDATILAGARAVADRYELGPDDRYPMVFPFTHIGGVGMLVVQLLSGCATLAVEQYDPERTPQFMGAHDVTVPAGGTPLALLYLQYQRTHPATRAFPRTRAVMTGAAPKPPGLHTDLQREIGGVGAVSVYGLTETPFLVVASVRDPDEKLATTEGRPVPGVELRVVDEHEHACGPDETGEIRARGVVVCAGYLNPERDAEAFDADGFFRTGDLGRVDADGYVTVSGRLKDVIIRKGENISAKEVEDVIYDHPSVAEVAVIGLPDAVLGERCCAVLLASAGREPPTLAEIAAWCGDAGLARQKWPEQVEVLTDFPRNASGKVLKYRLRELYGDRV